MKRKSNSFVGALAIRWKSGALSSLIFVFLSLFVLSSSMFDPNSFSKFRLTATDFFAPSISAVNEPIARAASFVSMVSGLTQMQRENARLRAENERLRGWYMAAMTLQTENTALQDVLNVKLSKDLSYVTARVMMDNKNAFMKSLLVDVGATDGVQANQAVVNEDGVIGRVLESGKTASRIVLLTDINSRIPVLIKNGDKTVKAILAGDNNGHPHFLHMTSDVALQDGAHVVTSGHGGVFPYGLPVGQVVQDGRADDVTLRPYADIDNAQFVRIVSQSHPLNTNQDMSTTAP